MLVHFFGHLETRLQLDQSINPQLTAGAAMNVLFQLVQVNIAMHECELADAVPSHHRSQTPLPDIYVLFCVD